MAYQIDASQCTGCAGCETECPARAIKPKADVSYIDPSKCVECKGFFDVPQCVQVCPADCIGLAA